MSEMLTPLEWAAQPEPSASTSDVPDAIVWPLPAGYAEPTAGADATLPCVIVGLNDSRMSGRVKRFVPSQALVEVLMPPSRALLPLRFDKFRSLTLTTPLRPNVKTGATEAADAATIVEYEVQLANGSTVTGTTAGFLEAPFGLFIFPVFSDRSGPDAVRIVRRQFFPRTAYLGLTTGDDIGKPVAAVLSLAATPPPPPVQEVPAARPMAPTSTPQASAEIKGAGVSRTAEQLLQALARQSNMPVVRVGEALLSLGFVDQVQLDEALKLQQADRTVPLGETLVRMGVVSRDNLRAALAHKMGFPVVNLDDFPCDVQALSKVPYITAERVQVMPLLVHEQRLIVALDDPAGRRSAVDEIEFVAQMKVVPVLAQCRSFGEALWAAYDKMGGSNETRTAPDGVQRPLGESQITGKLVETLEKEQREQDEGDDTDDRQIEQSDNSLVRLINSIIIDAHKDGVSDIHIESYPGREKIRVRFRKDGRMRTHLELPPNYRSALIARIKIMCDLDIAERRKPQDGKITFSKFSAQHRIELRVATIPTNGGMEDVVMRILASAKPLPVDKLGLSAHNLVALKTAVERPYGLVLCVGPTGSGKTTTLHSALSHINVPERKIWTAEDPIEITQAGLRQVQVNAKIDWTFAKALRAFLRADPDAIMVGEIRDQETAHMAVEASLTGHLVLSTLHTNSAPETVTRLLDMGLDPFNFADSLLAVLAQRLVRRLCSACRTSAPATPDEIEELLNDHLHAFGATANRPDADAVLADWTGRHGDNGRLLSHRSAGCKTCEQSGYKGRAGLHELMQMSRPLRHLVQTSARAEELQAVALNEGMRTLRHDGIDKVWAGVTSIEEVRATSNA